MRTTVSVTPPPRRGVPRFARWVANSTPRGATVLNIGAGSGHSGDLVAVRRRAAWLVGVDPTGHIHANALLDERHQQTLDEFAPDHPQRFDVAFSVFVLEHVADPAAFARDCARVLKPGGLLLGMTVNKWHYFGFTTWATTQLGIEDWLLHRLRDADEVDEHHFPTRYRMNTIASVTRHLDRAGFSRATFRMWDQPSLYTPYLPRPLRGVATTWNRAAYGLDKAQLMGHLTFKAVL